MDQNTRLSGSGCAQTLSSGGFPHLYRSVTAPPQTDVVKRSSRRHTFSSNCLL